MDVFKLGSEDTKINVSRACIERGLREALGNGQIIEGLDQATQIPKEGDVTSFMQNHFLAPKSGDQPEVFVKQIMKNEGFLHKKQVLSDEALVVVTLNNAKDWKERTVAVALVKVNKGQPDLSKGIFTVMSGENYMNSVAGYANRKEATYDSIDMPEQLGKGRRGGGIASDMNRVATKFARGEISIDEYHKRFRRENGKSLNEHWEQWDKEISNDLRHGKSERLKKETIHRLEGRYAGLLQETNEKTNKLVSEAEKAIEDHQASVEKFVIEPRNFDYLEGLLDEEPLIVELYTKTLKRDFKLTDGDIELVKKYGAAWVERKKKRGGGNGTTPTQPRTVPGSAKSYRTRL